MALYRIFFGHQHWQIIVESEVCPRKGMVIGKRMSDHIHATRSETGEKTLRIADGRHCMHTLAGKPRNGLFLPTAQLAHDTALQMHGNFTRLWRPAIAHAEIHYVQSL